jgi:hypothetical protein
VWYISHTNLARTWKGTGPVGEVVSRTFPIEEQGKCAGSIPALGSFFVVGDDENVNFFCTIPSIPLVAELFYATQAQVKCVCANESRLVSKACIDRYEMFCDQGMVT